MINVKDVIWLKVPYPNINSGLARERHMYVCMNSETGKKEFIKISSLKPTHFIHPIHHIIESPDINRNPFTKVSIIDCDKMLISTGIMFPIVLRTNRRPDICEDLYQQIMQESSYSGKIVLDTQWLLSLNSALCVIV